MLRKECVKVLASIEDSEDYKKKKKHKKAKKDLLERPVTELTIKGQTGLQQKLGNIYGKKNNSSGYFKGQTNKISQEKRDMATKGNLKTETEFLRISVQNNYP